MCVILMKQPRRRSTAHRAAGGHSARAQRGPEWPELRGPVLVAAKCALMARSCVTYIEAAVEGWGGVASDASLVFMFMCWCCRAMSPLRQVCWEAAYVFTSRNLRWTSWPLQQAGSGHCRVSVC